MPTYFGKTKLSCCYLSDSFYVIMNAHRDEIFEFDGEDNG